MILPLYEHRSNMYSIIYRSTYSYALHLHNSPELIYVHSGILKVQLFSEEYLMKDGDLLLVLPNVIHAYETLSPSQDTRIDLLVCGENFNSVFPQSYVGLHVENPIAPISSLHPDVEYVFNRLMQEDFKQADKQIILTYLQLLWQRLLPTLKITNPIESVSSETVTTLITYITEHFCEPLSLEILSKELGMGRFYLSRIFSQVLHVGFYEYVNKLRINHATNLLHNRRLTILDIALQCGFQNQQTFNRVFKEICGETPSVYRKKLLQ